MIECLHDRKTDGTDLSEGSLCRGLAAGGVFAEFAHQFLEALIGPEQLLPPFRLGLPPFRLGLPPFLVGLPPFLVGLPPFLVGSPAIGSHLDAQVP